MHDATDRPRRAWPWLLALVPCAAIGTALLLAGLGVVFNASGRSVAPSEAERSLLLTVEELGPWLPPGFIPDPADGRAVRTDYQDGSTELVYVYDAPDEAEAPFVAHSIRFEPSDAVARGTLRSQWGGTELGFWYGDEGFEVEEREPSAGAWGDESRFAVLRRRGVAFGNAYAARRGGVVVYVLLAGIAFDQETSLRSVLGSTLAGLDGFTPDAR